MKTSAEQLKENIKLFKKEFTWIFGHCCLEEKDLEEQVEFLKSHTISILQGEIEILKEKLIGQNVVFNLVARSKLEEANKINIENSIIQDQITHLEEEIKKINEEKI